MTRSRDTADQINRINSSAANATAITVDSSENVSLTGALDVTGTVTADGLEVSGLVTLDDYSGNSGRGRINIGNSGQKFIEGLDTGNGGSGSYLKIGSGSTTQLTIDNAGNVGIGVDAPVAALEVSRGNAAYAGIFSSIQGQGRVVLFKDNHASPTKYNWLIGAQYNANNAFEITPSTAVGGYTFSSVGLMVTETGNVLVGKTSVDSNTVGVEAKSDGTLTATVAADTVSILNRKTIDGEILRLQKDGSPVASIGVLNSNNLTVSGTVADHGGLQFGTHAVLPMEANADSNGTVDLGASGSRWKDLYLSGGVVFGPASASNVSSQTLDDYEQGTYTATVSPSSGTITLNTSYNTAAYTKVGRSVTVTGLLVASAVSSPSGTLDISLPFASANLIEGSERSTNVVTFWCNGAGAPTAGVWYNAMLILNLGGVSYLRVYMQGYNGSYNVNPGDWIGAGSDVHINFTYFTA